MNTLMVDQGIMTLVTIATFAMCGAFVLYVLYSVMWRAVRRGMQEFYQPAHAHQAVQHPEPHSVETSEPLRTRVSRRLPVRVPNYVPNDWN